MNEKGNDVEFICKVVGEYDRNAGSLCLKRYQGETLTVGRKHENVNRTGQQPRDIIAYSDERNGIPQAGLVHTRLDHRPKGTVANENETNMGILRDSRPGNVDQELVVLLLPEATNVTEHESVGRQTEFATHKPGR